MNNPTFATLNQSNPTHKTIIYLPDLVDFSRSKMDTMYRSQIQMNLANGGKHTLPVNHLHVQMAFDEPDLWDETIEAVKGFEGYLVLSMHYPKLGWWEDRNYQLTAAHVNTDAMTRMHALKSNLQSLISLLHDPDFKPKHIVLVGEWKSEVVNFINNIMLAQNVPSLHQLRGWENAVSVKVETE